MQLECEADHPPPYGAGVQNAWSFNFTSPVCLNGVVLRHRYHFALTHLHPRSDTSNVTSTFLNAHCRKFPTWWRDESHNIVSKEYSVGNM
jgi:hypothetical protein